LDLIVLFVLMVIDVRILKGSAVSSFTLLELFIWGYCAPYVVSALVLQGRRLPAQSQRFVFTIGLYGGWVCLTAILGILLRSSTDVLQNAKNVLPGLILVPFLLMRLRNLQSVMLLSNVYVIYGVVAAVLAIVQFKFGAPYFKELVEGTEYKQDLLGEFVSDPVVAFSGHPNEFAMSIIPALALAAIKAIGDFRTRLRINFVAIGITLLLLGAMVLAQAKGAFIFSVAAVAFVVSPFARLRSALLKFGWVALFILAIVVLGLYATDIGANDGAATVAVRFLLWQIAFKGIGDDWYIGVFGDGRGYVHLWSEPLAGWEFLDSHNAWVDQIVMFGVPALILYAAIWWVFFRTIDQPARPRPASVTFLLDGFRVSLLAIMGDSFFEPVANDVTAVSQLLLIMVMALQVASFQSSVGPTSQLRQNFTASRSNRLQPIRGGRPGQSGEVSHF
jgi:hypothetical protein